MRFPALKNLRASFPSLIRVIFILLVIGFTSWLLLGYLGRGKSILPFKTVPKVHVRLTWKNDKGEIIPAPTTKYGSSIIETPTPPASSPTSTPGSSSWWGKPTPTPEPAERQISLIYPLTPTAFSFSILRGKKFLEWMSRNKAFFESDPIQGLFSQALQTTKIRGEDLSLSSEMKGRILLPVLEEVITRGAILHYNTFQGSKGWVLEGNDDPSSLQGSSLSLLQESLTRRVYDLQDRNLFISEILIGTQSLFIARVNGRFFAGLSLQGVLNILETSPLASSPEEDADGVVRIRPEAWLRALMPVVMSKNQSTIDVTFNFANSGIVGAQILTSPIRALQYLHPYLSESVLRSIPKDIVGAFAGAFSFSPDTADQSWKEMGANGVPRLTQSILLPETTGIALIWDVSLEKGELKPIVGFVVHHSTENFDPQQMEKYFSSHVSSTSCGDTSIWIGATSQRLLTRMKEACEGQNPSIGSLDAFDKQRLVAFFNPAPLFIEGLKAGAAVSRQERGVSGDSLSSPIPGWKQRYAEAVTASVQQGTETFSRIPPILFSGDARFRSPNTDPKASLSGTIIYGGNR